MIMKYILEYVAICDYLVKNQVKKRRGYLVVDREALETMLNKNRFEPAKDKLRTWKQMNWIATDEERLTKRIYQDGKYVPMVFICEKVYLELKRLNGIGSENGR